MTVLEVRNRADRNDARARWWDPGYRYRCRVEGRTGETRYHDNLSPIIHGRP